MFIIRWLGLLLCVPGFICIYSGGLLLYHLFTSSSRVSGDAEVHLGASAYYLAPEWIGAGMLLGGGAVVAFALMAVLYTGKERKTL